jgi:hypothetical protein
MGRIKGQKEWEKFQKGGFLSRKEAILANCYLCNGLEESAVDCKTKKCPLYRYSPYSSILRAETGGFLGYQNKR